MSRVIAFCTSPSSVTRFEGYPHSLFIVFLVSGVIGLPAKVLLLRIAVWFNVYGLPLCPFLSKTKIARQLPR